MTYYAAGRKQILNNPRTYGEVLWRPVDRRENYVKTLCRSARRYAADRRRSGHD